MTQQPTQTASTAVAKKQIDIASVAQEQIDKLIADNGLVLPDNYAVGNAIQEAYLTILDVKDMNKQPALTVCDQASVVRSIRNMVIQGLSVGKKQGYFIVYGNQLSFQRSYFGTLAVAKRFANVIDIIAQVIIKGDETDTEIINGEERVTKHVRKNRFEQTVTFDNIIGTYAIVKFKNGSIKWEIMDGQQIHAAWNKSKTSQGTHKEFPDQMAKKTVIGRALKLVINSSDDAPLLVKAFNESNYVEDSDEGLIGLEESAFTEAVDVDEVMSEPPSEALKTADTKPLPKHEQSQRKSAEQTSLLGKDPF